MLVKNLLLVLGVLFAANVDAVVRTALDVGSGGVKVTVADVDPVSQKINKVYYADELVVSFKTDMLLSGKPCFSEEIQQKAIDTLAKLQQEMKVYHPLEWKGIATAASRQSENAGEFYERVKKELGIDITIISQAEEGRIGFETALAVSGIPAENIVAYDSGSGSFQLTTLINGKIEVTEGPFGFMLAVTELVSAIRGKQLESTPNYNPVSVEEAQLLVQKLKPHLPKLSKEFIEKLKNKDTVVVGIGNQNYIFASGAIAVGKNTYTKEELWQAITLHSGKTDQELSVKKFGKAYEAMVGMILLYSVMDGLGIDQITYANANGSCEGLLIDPHYWNSSKLLAGQ